MSKWLRNLSSQKPEHSSSRNSAVLQIIEKQRVRNFFSSGAFGESNALLKGEPDYRRGATGGPQL
jgi:hypothetical protein